VRLLNLGTVPAPLSQATYHAVAETALVGDAPTLVLVSPDRPYVCVGFHQVASREVEREYLESEGILVARRLVGGGAVWLDRDQLFWHLILPDWHGAVDALYARYLPAQVAVYRRFGVEASWRPVNDIVVGVRKIGGTGAARIGTATVLVGSFLFDFPIHRMARAIRVPSEKFRDKLVDSLAAYMTSLRRELGTKSPHPDQVADAFVDEVAQVLGEPAVPGYLSETEQQAAERYARQLFDPAFVYRHEGWMAPGVKIREGVRLFEGVHKAPGGLVRFIWRERDGVFDDVVIGGDFFVTPRDGLERLAASLVGRPVGVAAVEAMWRGRPPALSVPGVGGEDLAAAFLAAADVTHGATAGTAP